MEMEKEMEMETDTENGKVVSHVCYMYMLEWACVSQYYDVSGVDKC